MLIIPAIDLKDGACVRLRQGLMDDATVFSDDPVAMAAKWVEAGCRRLHLVDLNGAFEGKPVNGAAVTAIAKRYPNLPIQIGGGIRSLETIEEYIKARRFEADGVSAIVYTDIAKDGMMQGCNVEATAALANATSIPVIASGGIHNLGDIQTLLNTTTPGIIGAITGRAIYEGTLDVAVAQALCDEHAAR